MLKRIFEDDTLIVDYNKKEDKYILSFFYEGHFIEEYSLKFSGKKLTIS